jgi:hypothetical protein
MFFFEKKNQKTFPGCFARSGTVELKMSAPQAFERWNACGAGEVSPAVDQAPTDRSFLLLFFKKEALPSACLHLT